MKNNKRPLSTERVIFWYSTQIHRKYGFRGQKKWRTKNLPFLIRKTKHQNQLNDDWN